MCTSTTSKDTICTLQPSRSPRLGRLRPRSPAAQGKGGGKEWEGEVGGAGLPAARRQLAIECTSPSRLVCLPSLLTVNKFFDVSARLGAEAQRKVMGRLPRQRLSVHLMHNLGPAQVGTPVQHLPQVGSGGEMQMLAP